ncbi:MAG TPA: THUMP domain-containing protein [Casimicrobiaceae bacterium]|nr:THUMP domain-containing protein [Casimicrobiaceae bacterium]
MASFFAPCPRGLEALLEGELQRLDVQAIMRSEGGVAFEGAMELALMANLESRFASRILWRVGGGRYRDERDVNAVARAIDWPAIFTVDRTLRVDVAATRSKLTSLAFAALTIKDAIVDRFRAESGRRPSVDKRAPDVRVHAHSTTDEVTIYVDTSGEPLFKRGYRRDTEDAPLRENLAAGLVALSDWKPGTAFLDPLCGSGTIAIEAALMAADRAPGLNRTFGFQKLVWYDGPVWQRIRQRAVDRARPAPSAPSIFASDTSPRAIALATSNAQRAKVGEWITFERADVLTRQAPSPSGTLVANPPYGVRVSDTERLDVFYPKLGDALKTHFAGWHAWLLTGDPALAKAIRLKPARRIPLYNGAIECRFVSFPLVAGSHRKTQ